MRGTEALRMEAAISELREEEKGGRREKEKRKGEKRKEKERQRESSLGGCLIIKEVEPRDEGETQDKGKEREKDRVCVRQSDKESV